MARVSEWLERRRREMHTRQLERLERQRSKLERERVILEKRAPVEELRARIRRAKGPGFKEKAWKWISTPPTRPITKQIPLRPTPPVPEHRPVTPMQSEMERLERVLGIRKKERR